MTKTPVRLLALLATLSVAACGDDPTDIAGDLSQAEAEELATLIFSNSFFGLAGFAPAQTAGPALAPQPVTGSFSTSVSCPLGGSTGLAVELSGTEDDETGALDVTMDATLIHDACVLQAQSGTQFTVTGNPSLNVQFGIESDGGDNVDWTGDIEGSFDFESDGRSGTCIVDLMYTGGVNGQSISFSSSGSICGASVSTNFSFSG